MKIGFIGAGDVTRTFGRHLVNAGHTIVVSNSRGPETLAEFIADLGPLAKAVSKKDALEADIVVLATHFIQAPQALEGLKWRGQILIDATNAHSTSPADLSPAGVKRSLEALKGRTSSEIIADMVPGATLVKAISNMPMRWISDFSKDKPKTVIFVSGDDQAAKDKVVSLLDEIGFAGIDLGPLRTGGALQQLGGASFSGKSPPCWAAPLTANLQREIRRARWKTNHCALWQPSVNCDYGTKIGGS